MQIAGVGFERVVSMRLLYTILARYAELDQDGVFTVVGGGFNGIRTAELPVTVPNLSVLMKIAPDPEDNGDFRLGVFLIDPAGTPVMAGASEIPFTIERNSPRREVTCLLHMQGLEIRQPGLHQFRVRLMGGAELGAVPFTIEQGVGGGQ